jgi:hypothetical protein
LGVTGTDGKGTAGATGAVCAVCAPGKACVVAGGVAAADGAACFAASLLPARTIGGLTAAVVTACTGRDAKLASAGWGCARATAMGALRDGPGA